MCHLVENMNLTTHQWWVAIPGIMRTAVLFACSGCPVGTLQGWHR
jgi:hypothetical protein